MLEPWGGVVTERNSLRFGRSSFRSFSSSLRCFMFRHIFVKFFCDDALTWLVCLWLGPFGLTGASSVSASFIFPFITVAVCFGSPSVRWLCSHYELFLLGTPISLLVVRVIFSAFLTCLGVLRGGLLVFQVILPLSLVFSIYLVLKWNKIISEI